MVLRVASGHPCVRDPAQVKGQTRQLIHNVQFTQDITRKGSLCKCAEACVQKAALGCVRIRRGKCVPGSRVGVSTTCVNQTMWLSVCVSAWAGGVEGECGKLGGS